MAMQEVIERLTIETVERGGAQAAATQKNLAAAQDAVTVASERTERATLSMERRLESIQRRYDVEYRKLQDIAKINRDLEAARSQGLISLDRQNQLLQLAEARFAGGAVAAGAHAGALNLSQQQMSNLSFQMNDMATMLASGQSPFVMLMQQGMQIGQVFGPGAGVGAALRATGAALVAFITNPINLAILGFATLAGAASAAFGAIASSGGSVEELLKRQKDLVDEMANAFTKAGKEAMRLGEVSAPYIRLQSDRNTGALQATLDSSITASRGYMPLRDTSVTEHSYVAARTEIEKFYASVDAGMPKIAEFRDAMATIANDPSIPAGIRSTTLAIAEQAQGWAMTAAAIARAKEARLEFELGIRAEEYRKARPFGTVFDEAGEFKKSGLTSEMRTGASMQKQFDDALKSAQKATDALVAEAEALGLGAGAAAAYRKEQELLDLAKANGLKLTAAEIASVERLASAYGDATQKLAEQRALRDLAFERSQIFRSPTEQGVASSLRGIYGDDWESQLDGAIARQMRLNSALQIGKDLSKEFASGFVSDLRQGKTATEALTSALNRLADRLLDMALDAAITGLFKNLIGGLGFSGGGLVGSSLGRSSIEAFSVPSFALGGYVNGPGTATSDSIPARLSAGEFVVNARATSRYLPMLAEINGGMGAAGPGYARGGYVDPRPASSGGVKVEVIVNGNAKVEQQRSRTPDGQELVRLLVDAVHVDYAGGGFDEAIRAQQSRTAQRGMG